jgi:tetratricopeptide (TPR) repeat protein/Zn-dependent protease
MNNLTQGSFRLFRVAGITVFLHWSWFLAAYLFLVYRVNKYETMSWNIAEYVTLFGIVLLHEFGHALACRSVGGTANTIVLWPLGGIAFVAPPPRPGAVLWSIAAGPLVNVLLVPVTFGCLHLATNAGWQRQSPDAYQFVQMVTFINLVLLIFNVMPVYPLDGGQILHAILWFFMGRARSLKVVSFIGLFAGLILVGVAFFYEDAWIGIMAAFIAWRSLVGYSQGNALSLPGMEFLDRAVGHLQQKEYRHAVAACTEAIEQIRNNDSALAAAYLHRGLAYAALGEYEEAVADQSQAVQLSGHPATYLARGNAYLRWGKLDQAIEDFSSAIQLDPNSSAALAARGAIHSRRGDYGQAIADCTRALAIDPSNAAAYANRANARVQAGKPDQAIADCNEAIRLDPELPTAWYCRGNAHNHRGEHDLAIADFTQAIRCDPEFAEAYANRGHAYQRKGDQDRAIADLSEAIRLDPHTDAAFQNRALVLMKKGAYDQAIADCNEAIRLNPQPAPVYSNRALIHRKMGDYDQALADYAEALRLDPNYANGMNNLAWMLATCARNEVRDGPRALQQATQACELSRWQNPSHLSTLAAASAEVGDFARAVELQKKALECPEYRKQQDEDKARQRLHLYEAGKPYREE